MGGKKKSKGGGGKKANKNNKSPPRGSFGKASKSVSGREEEPVTPTSKKIGNKSVPVSDTIFMSSFKPYM